MTSPAVHMTWSQLLFIHWRVKPAQLASLLPPGLEIDTFDGAAWVGLVPFTMPQIRPRWWPRAAAVTGLTRFHECNVRTYVRHGDEAGVWFLSLDAASRLAVTVASRRWHLPYKLADITLAQRAGETHYDVRRRNTDAAMHCVWRTGATLPQSSPGDIEHFLTERYALFAWDGTNLHRGRVDHEPWPLRKATLVELDDTLVKAGGVTVSGKPAHVCAAQPIDVVGSGLEILKF